VEADKHSQYRRRGQLHRHLDHTRSEMQDLADDRPPLIGPSTGQSSDPRPRSPDDERRIVAAIVNFNRAALTDRAVTSFLAQEGSHEVRLVVVDDGSRDDDVRELVSRIGDRADLVLLTANRGYAAACNVAARLALAAGAEFTWLLNNDLMFPRSTLRQLVQHLEGHPELAAVAPVTVRGDDPRTVLGAGVDVRLARAQVRHRHEGAGVADLPWAPYEVTALEGACLLIRTEALRRIGPLDEGFFMYWEDTEWSMRARRLGYRLGIVPSAQVPHLVAQSSQAAERVALMMRNRIRFVRRIGSDLDQATFLTYFLLAWLPAFYLARLAPRFGPARGARIAWESIGWNVRDARLRRSWRLRRSPNWEMLEPSVGDVREPE
jgi:GT2 family glycosyltransferase